jgi:hypothetical protein
MSLKKKFFMLQKFLHDLKTPRQRYPIAKDLSSQNLGYYYFLFTESRISTGKDQRLLKKFDQNGIPLNQTYIDVQDKQFVYFPITIGQMGLAIFHTWLQTKKEKDKQRFLNFPAWFAANAQVSDALGAVWLTEVPLPQYQNPGPWQSAFVQARALNILLRGYQLTANQDWYELAEMALKPFTIPVNEGGVTSFTEYGAFYEEYTAQVPTLVLNGMMFALFGLYDYVRVFPQNKTAQELFAEGTNTLSKILPRYDLGFWSRYNLCQTEWYPEIDPATIQYQRLHIAQLKVLYRITSNQIFQKYANIFNSQDTFRNALKMYNLKFRSLKKINRL